MEHILRKIKKEHQICAMYPIELEEITKDMDYIGADNIFWKDGYKISSSKSNPFNFNIVLDSKCLKNALEKNSYNNQTYKDIIEIIETEKKELCISVKTKFNLSATQRGIDKKKKCLDNSWKKINFLSYIDTSKIDNNNHKIKSEKIYLLCNVETYGLPPEQPSKIGVNRIRYSPSSSQIGDWFSLLGYSSNKGGLKKQDKEKIENCDINIIMFVYIISKETFDNLYKNKLKDRSGRDHFYWNLNQELKCTFIDVDQEIDTLTRYAEPIQLQPNNKRKMEELSYDENEGEDDDEDEENEDIQEDILILEPEIYTQKKKVAKTDAISRPSQMASSNKNKLDLLLDVVKILK
jgi:hypothetical protein